MRKIYVYGIIALFAFVLYGNTTFNEYALDDSLVITNNRFTKNGFKGLKEIFSCEYFRGCDENLSAMVYGGRYRPLSMATFAIEYEILRGKSSYKPFYKCFSLFIDVLADL